MSTPAILALKDGTIFQGISIGGNGQTVGEVVFNTAMTGYQEILTDPSYAQQIIMLTYPHIGNTGTNREDMESEKIFASGLVIREPSMITSSWRSDCTLSEFLKNSNTIRCDKGLDPPSDFCIAILLTISFEPTAQPTRNPGANILENVPIPTTKFF